MKNARAKRAAKPEISIEKLAQLGSVYDEAQRAAVNLACAENLLDDVMKRMQGAADYGSNPGIVRDLNALRQLRKLVRKAASHAETAQFAAADARQVELDRC